MNALNALLLDMVRDWLSHNLEDVLADPQWRDTEEGVHTHIETALVYLDLGELDKACRTGEEALDACWYLVVSQPYLTLV